MQAKHVMGRYSDQRENESDQRQQGNPNARNSRRKISKRERARCEHIPRQIGRRNACIDTRQPVMHLRRRAAAESMDIVLEHFLPIASLLFRAEKPKEPRNVIEEP